MNPYPGKGCNFEQMVLERFPALRKASWKDNYENDIDAWCKGIPISIKQQLRSQQTNRYAFEQTLIDGEGNQIPGWWAKRQPGKIYLIGDGERIRSFVSEGIEDYISKNFLHPQRLSLNGFKSKSRDGQRWAGAELILAAKYGIDKMALKIFGYNQKENHES